jgi:hypothetical protein
MIRKLTAALVVICAMSAIGASGAWATSEYFYHENSLCNECSVSSSPHNVNFVGAYKGYTGSFEIGLCSPVNCASGIGRQNYGTGTSLTESFPAESGRGYLKNNSGKTGTFTAEIRY